MKRFLIPVFAALALSSCAGLSGIVSRLPTAPVGVADQNTLDERGALAVELAYQAANRAAEALVDGGLIEGASATRVAELDRKAFAAVQAARRAYDTGNAASYTDALREARSEIAALLQLLN